jgi:hypothetical protein
MIDLREGRCYGSRTCSACGDGDEMDYKTLRYKTKRDDLHNLRIGHGMHYFSMTLCEVCISSLLVKCKDFLEERELIQI